MAKGAESAIAEDAPASSRGIYPGWSMVGLAFIVILFASSAASVTLPIVYGDVIKEFGWTRTQATMIFTYKQAASSIIALFVIGPMIDRFGLKVVTSFLCLSTAIGMTMFLWVHSLWTYYLAGILFGMGGTTILIPTKLMVTRWFSRNLGLASGVAMLGLSVGGAVFPFMMGLLDDRIGWRAAFASLSIGIWIVGLPMFLLFARTNPTDAETLPELVGRTPDPALVARVKAAEPVETLRQILTSRMFAFIGIGLFVIGAIDAGMLQHTILYLKEEAGLSNAVAAATLSGTFLLGFASKIVAGKAYDSFSIRGIQVWNLLLTVAILMTFAVHDFRSAMVFTVVRGIAHGGLVGQIPVLARQCYGRRYLSRILPIMTGLYGVGAACGPITLSLLYDWTGGYETGFGLLAASCVLSVILYCWVQPRYLQRLAQL